MYIDTREPESHIQRGKNTSLDQKKIVDPMQIPPTTQTHAKKKDYMAETSKKVRVCVKIKLRANKALDAYFMNESVSLVTKKGNGLTDLPIELVVVHRGSWVPLVGRQSTHGGLAV